MAVDVPAAELDIEAPPRGLASATFEATAFRFAVLPLSFATTIITSRYLLPAGRGAFVLALLTVTLAWTLLSNISAAVTKEIGFHRRSATPILMQGLALAVGFGVVGGIVLVPLNVEFSDTQRVVAIASLALPAMLVTQVVSGALLPLGRFRSVNLLQLLPQLFVVIGMVVLVVFLHERLKGAVVAWTIAQVIVGVVALWMTRDIWLRAFRGEHWLEPNRLRPMFELGVLMGAVNLVAMLNYRIELFVLQAYRGLGEVGVYSVAASLAEFAWMPVAALAAVSTPAIVNTESGESVAALAKSVRHAVVLAIGFAVLVGALGVAFIPFLFGERFADARAALVILLPAIVLFAPTKVIAVYLSSRLGRPGFQFAVAATSTVVTAVAAVALIPSLGMNGAALSTCIGYASGMVLEAAVLSRFDVELSSLIPRRADLSAYRTMAATLLARARPRT